MRKGFTLIELLIVLAVIAALMAIVTPIALNAVAQARATQVASNMRNIKSAAESYVNIERPTGNKALSDLITSGYLSTNPGTNYSAAITPGSTQVTITVTFSGNVDKDKVVNILPEATYTGSTLKLTSTVARWW
ncbi:MAG: type II secretion system protein [Pseudothermotoga sp.]